MKKICRILSRRLGSEKIVLKLGKAWMSIDRTGIVSWSGTRNYYYIWQTY